MTSNTPLSESVVSSSVPAAPLAREPKPLPAWVLEILLPIATIVVLFAIWEAACRLFAVPSYIIPTPSAIWTAVSQSAGNVAGHTLTTTRTVLLGFFVSVAISLPLAVLLTSSPLVAAAVNPLLVLTQAIPKVALAPILVVVLGTSELPRVVVTFLVAFFPLVLSMAAGLVSVPPELIELGRACKASRWAELWRIRLPYAVPFIFSGLKSAIALAVVGAVVAEFVNSEAGLGYLIQTSTAFFKVELAWGALLILSIIGIVLFQIIVAVERIFFPWSTGTAKTGI
jgi:NitT/TauT family transport system permease protein